MSAADVAIVGAGPYGLSLAAHLARLGADFRIFGSPMRSWLAHMPKGMHLKSDGFASSLSAPDPSHSLKAFCLANHYAYHDTDIPVPLATFNAYAMDFVDRFVPAVEDRTVEQLEPAGDGEYRLYFREGGSLTARKVVLAVGLSYFAQTPEPLLRLPAELATHSWIHHDLERFRGRDVTVIGAGSSAVELSALLHEVGAGVRLVARGGGPRFTEPPKGRTNLLELLRRPPSGLGPGWRSRIYADVPTLFRRLPPSVRVQIARTHLGPLSPWRLKDRVMGRVSILAGHALERAEARGGRAILEFVTAAGGRTIIETDHVIAATGYRSDLRRLPFLGEAMRERIRTVEHTPVLSARFEASAPGLYFLGPVAASTFGPLMRFMFGTDFAARRLGASLAGGAR